MRILTPQQQIRKELVKVLNQLKTTCENGDTHSVDVALIISTTLPELKSLVEQLFAYEATYDKP